MAQTGIDETLKLEVVYLTAPVPRNLGVLTVLGAVFDKVYFPGVHMPKSGYDPKEVEKEILRLEGLQDRSHDTQLLIGAMKLLQRVKTLEGFCEFTADPDDPFLRKDPVPGQLVQAVYDSIHGPPRPGFIPSFRTGHAKGLGDGAETLIYPGDYHYIAGAIIHSGQTGVPLLNDIPGLQIPGMPNVAPVDDAKLLAHLTPFFTAREREHAGCQHRLFFSQVEYCDNLIFRRRAALDNLGQRLLDANRTIGQPNKITVIFGRKVSKQYRGKLQTEIEDMNLPNPVIRSHYGNGFIKQYVRDHLVLRTEAASNNVNDYGVKKAVENLPVLQKSLSAINDNYLNVQQDILETFVDRGQLRKLAKPTVTSTGKRIPGLKLDHPRQLALMHALVRFAHIAAGNTFTTAEIHPAVIEALGCTPESYTLASLRYDLSKLRAKGLVAKLPNSRRYQLLPQGYSICLVFLKLFERVYAPLTAGLLSPIKADARLESQRRSQLDRLYQRVIDDLDTLVRAVGLKAA
jgi:hypothetical protein